MRIAVADTETTGLGETDEVLEIAVVYLDEDGKAAMSHTLIRPSVPVNVAARATHHISDEMLLAAPTMAEALAKMPGLLTADVLAAHNAEFDLRMLRQSGVSLKILPPRTICTYRCALHLFPDAPAHGNQVLRYHLGLGAPENGDLPTHRALSDAIVTAKLLIRMLEERSINQLVELTQMPVLLNTVRFGKHAGKLWQDVESDYLQWVLSKNDFNPDVTHTARHWLTERRKRRAALP